MKILIIGPKSIENELLIKAGEARKHTVTLVSISKLTFGLHKNNYYINYNQKDIAGFDVCLIRGVNPYFAQAKTVAKYLYRNKVSVIDKELYQKVYDFNKMFMYSALSYHGLPCPNTYFFPNIKAFKQAKLKFDFPVLIKDLHGMHGRNIYIRESNKELMEFYNWRNIKHFFVQQIINADHYFRVLMVGNKVLGAMKRYTLLYLKNKNIPLGERSFPHKITKEMKALARQAAQATNSDIAGVDIIYDDKDRPYILEVNRSPNFKRFSQVNKVDVADEIIQYLEKCKAFKC